MLVSLVSNIVWHYWCENEIGDANSGHIEQTVDSCATDMSDISFESYKCSRRHKKGSYRLEV